MFLGIATCMKNGKHGFYSDALCKLFWRESRWVLKKLSELKPNCTRRIEKYRYQYKGCVCELNGRQVAYLSIVDMKYRHGIYCMPLDGICYE